MVTSLEIQDTLLEIVKNVYSDKNFGAACIYYLFDLYKNKVNIKTIYNLRLDEYKSVEAQFRIFYEVVYTRDPINFKKVDGSRYVSLQNALTFIMYNSTTKGLDDIFRFINSKHFDPNKYNASQLQTKLYEYVSV